MAEYEVTMARAGSGSGSFEVTVHASTPDGARRAAEQQNPGFEAIAVRRVF